MVWLNNPDANEVGDIEEGDIIHLKNDDGLGFLLKGIVSKVEGNKVFANVEASFALNGEGQILDGLSIKYVQKELEFDKSLVHKVVKNN